MPKAIEDEKVEVAERVQIYEFRGKPVVVDQDLARFFGIKTKALNQQVKRNEDKFSDDFAFRLAKEEFADLKSRKVTSSSDWGGTRYPPNVFTEHGVVMAATGPMLETARGFRNQAQVTVQGSHFIQEDSGPEIGKAIMQWIKNIS